MFNPIKVGRDLRAARRGPGGRRWPADFSDRLTAPLPGWRDTLRMLRESRAAQASPHQDEAGQAPPHRGAEGQASAGGPGRIPVDRRAELPRAADGQTLVTWAGHASYVLQIGGLTVLADPVWSGRIPGVQRRLTPVGVPWSALPHIDVVLISHNHYDHLDGPTIRRLPRRTPLLVPANLAWWFRQRGFRDVTDLDWWESREINGVRFEFVPAHHWSRRTLTDANRSLWGGWVLTDRAGTRIYFAGDSGYGHWFRRIGERCPGIDLALLPVGAYEPAWFMQPVHMNPEEAVRACADLGASRLSPMHWGTFLLSAEPPLEPLIRTRAAWQAAGRDRADLWDLAIGETRELDPGRQPR